ncbi:hypothetical protein TWF569_006172 [Orbilia oligospora]|uniref:Rhodanese domain-containing protein n=1 Tax=Orbilia oligospora TaxID=2813651 RepID=A0A7C8NVB9_ORBOL|nr:hypothetical protein TWF706_001835 [Orbilia oligospora]KAF3110578.1 hypothetical protein TWF102_008151 [Orbilia oligospora]KAF3114824.1 hypothetical protein TWF103_000550 [Orbilia oligospora]KAF3147081.1 hypothetical protein TWF569_006172 [Orbilia oligospora]
MYTTSFFPFRKLIADCSRTNLSNSPLLLFRQAQAQSIRTLHLSSSSLHKMSCEAPPTADGSPWHAAFPSPRTTKPGALTRKEVLELLQKEGRKDFVLVDLRRNDYELIDLQNRAERSVDQSISPLRVCIPPFRLYMTCSRPVM